jgi:sortase A
MALPTWAADIAMNGWIVRQVIRAAGEILLTAGVVGLLFLGYLVWGTGLRAASAQRALSGELNHEWRQGPVRGDAVGASPERFDVATGQPFAFIRIPAFGKQWRYTLIQGTALAQLNVSPGHVPGTQWPGQLGNFAVAGHRVTAGNPFWSLPSMKDGDLVYVQTRLNNYTYRVTGKQWVAPTDTAVLDPVPGHRRQRPNRRLISLITCDPAWTGTHRVIVTGVLVAAKPR